MLWRQHKTTCKTSNGACVSVTTADVDATGNVAHYKACESTMPTMLALAQEARFALHRLPTWFADVHGVYRMPSWFFREPCVTLLCLV